MTLIHLDHARETRALRDRIEELEEEVRQLRADFTGANLPALPGWLHLTPQQGALVNLLRRHAGRPLDYRTIHAHIAPPETETRIVNVVACKARAKLRQAGVWITTIHGHGLMLDRDEALKLEALIERERRHA